VTIVVRDPGFYGPTAEDNCTTFGYFCQARGGPYRGDAYQGGPSHLIVLDCGEHGLESMWPQGLMLMLPEGLTPPLNDEQLAWAPSEDDACSGTRRDRVTCVSASVLALSALRRGQLSVFARANNESVKLTDLLRANRSGPSTALRHCPLTLNLDRLPLKLDRFGVTSLLQ
jgi:hypothetical protein